jgi:4-hydroxy-4-methyl-2-oxoglutarate aldolase
VTDDIVRRFAGLGVSVISDAMDRNRWPGQVHGVRPLREGCALAGRAFTVRYQPVDDQGGTVGDYIDDVAPGAVVVLDNGGRTDVTVWGDLLTTVAAARGVSGTVIDGVCRDVDRARQLGYPVFGRGSYMRTGKDRVQVADIQEPVTLSSVRVRPGDLVVADSDGVVVVPREREEELMYIAEEIERAENLIREAIAQGQSLRAARSEAGYFTLQRAASREAR